MPLVARPLPMGRLPDGPRSCGMRYGPQGYACNAIWMEECAPLRLVRNFPQLSSPSRHLGIASWLVCVVCASERQTIDCGHLKPPRSGSLLETGMSSGGDEGWRHETLCLGKTLCGGVFEAKVFFCVAVAVCH